MLNVLSDGKISMKAQKNELRWIKMEKNNGTDSAHLENLQAESYFSKLCTNNKYVTE